MGPDEVLAALRTDGHVIVPGLLPEEVTEGVRAALAPALAGTPFGANSFVGRHTRRLFGLPALTRALDDLLVHDLVVGTLEAVLGPLLLSTAVAVEIHPGEVAQTLHTDDGAWPVPAGGGEFVANAIWAIDDFDESNGATRFADGSVAEMPAGSVLLYLGSVRHGGGANGSARPRLGIVTGYTAAWLRPQENFALTCPPSVAASAPPRLQALLGYSLYPPFVGHVAGDDPASLLRALPSSVPPG